MHTCSNFYVNSTASHPCLEVIIIIINDDGLNISSDFRKVCNVAFCRLSTITPLDYLMFS